MTTAPVQIVAPTAEFSEKAMLAAILGTDADTAFALFTKAREIVHTPEMFSNKAYAEVYAAIMTAADTTARVSTWSVGTMLERSDALAKVGGEKFLKELVESNDHYPIELSAEEVREAYLQRRTIDVLRDAATTASTKDAVHAVAEARAGLDAIEAGLTTGDDALISGADLFDAFWDNVENPKPMIAYTTGLKDLDDTIGGLVPGTLTVTAARPGGGKSLLLMKMARSVATKGFMDRHEAYPTLLVSLEMNATELEYRRVAAVAGVEFSHLKRQEVTDRDKQRILKKRDVLRTMPLELLPVTSINVPQIKAYARKVAAKYDGRMPVIFVDYIQLMDSTSNTRADLRHLIVGEVSRALKVLAMELETPVVVAAQLNRGSASRTDHRPLVTDLRESGSVEQDADTVLLLHREADYDDKAPGEEMQIIAGKNRNGVKGAVVKALWLPHKSDIDNYADEDGSHTPVAKAAPVPDFGDAWTPSHMGVS